MGVPEAFLNTEWIEDSSENLDDYLVAIGLSSFERHFAKEELSNNYFYLVKIGAKYMISNIGPKDRRYTFQLGEAFVDKGYDDKDHRICFAVEGDKLIEQHKHIRSKKGKPNDHTEYSMRDGRLVAEDFARDKQGNTVILRRYYKKTVSTTAPGDQGGASSIEGMVVGSVINGVITKALDAL